MAEITLYRLYRERDSFVKWQGLDGDTHSIDAANPAPVGQWAFTLDSNSRPVMAYRLGYGDGHFSDGELVVSLEGAPSLLATLLHEGDDTPRKYYYATDGGWGNSNPLNRPAFILRAEGIRDMPVVRYAGFRVMIVSP